MIMTKITRMRIIIIIIIIVMIILIAIIIIIIKTVKFTKVIGYHHPEFGIRRTMYASCLLMGSVIGQFASSACAFVVYFVE